MNPNYFIHYYGNLMDENPLINEQFNKWANERNIDSMKTFIKLFPNINYELLLYSLQYDIQFHKTEKIAGLFLLSGINPNVKLTINLKHFTNEITNLHNTGIIAYI